MNEIFALSHRRIPDRRRTAGQAVSDADSGYNTMPTEKKKNVDIAGLSSFMRRHLVIIGALWVLLANVLNLTGQQDALPVVYVISTFRSTSSGCWSGRSDHNKQ